MLYYSLVSWAAPALETLDGRPFVHPGQATRCIPGVSRCCDGMLCVMSAAVVVVLFVCAGGRAHPTKPAFATLQAAGNKRVGRPEAASSSSVPAGAAWRGVAGWGRWRQLAGGGGGYAAQPSGTSESGKARCWGNPARYAAHVRAVLSKAWSASHSLVRTRDDAPLQVRGGRRCVARLCSFRGPRLCRRFGCKRSQPSLLFSILRRNTATSSRAVPMCTCAYS